jgi:starch phosphorylase
VYAGERDLTALADRLARRVPTALEPLARLAYNYRWSWAPDGPGIFAAIDPQRWHDVGRNPVALLDGTDPDRLDVVAHHPALIDRVTALADAVNGELRSPPSTDDYTPDRPIAFFSAEFGVHESLPVYSGGLGVLAGDILKEASDLGVPMVGVGLLYRSGYFHQRLDTAGHQHEYWTELDPVTVPIALVRADDGTPVTVTVPIGDEDVTVQVWRADVGRVPLYLLDTDVPANSVIARWITARLYEGNRDIRLAQYAVLGAGGLRALGALGIAPALMHLNEGHPALAIVQAEIEDRAIDTVFTTHTPVAAGNETYPVAQLRRVLGRLAGETGDAEAVFAAGRVDLYDADAEAGLTPLALRRARRANAVSELHGKVARDMWAPLGVDITHVTNGAHLPTWLSRPMRELFDRHFGAGWFQRADDPTTWASVDDIPDDELWAARNAARHALVDRVRVKAARDRLRRGEDVEYASAAVEGFADDRLTLGFARRVATYKRLYLLSMRPDRALELLAGDPPVQLLIAGKAHPLDESAKQMVADLFKLKSAATAVGEHVAFLEDYDLSVAPEIVAGCDVWLNVPRPPFEASGTSGMKACFNGALHLSVLDGWWAEAYDGTNGWAIDGDREDDEAAQDERHADALFDLLERDVVPMFNDRDDGIPRRWLAMVRASLRTNGPRFSATRMVRDYLRHIYA